MNQKHPIIDLTEELPTSEEKQSDSSPVEEEEEV